MTTLATVLRGLRSRSLLSVGSLVLIVVAVAGTVLGPMFQQAATTSYTLTRLDSAPDPLTALTWQLRAGRATDLNQLVAQGVSRVEELSPDLYGTPEVTLTTRPVLRAGDGAQFTYLARDGVCSLLEVRGRCPTTPREVMVGAADLGALRIGDRYDLPGVGRLQIVGTYTTPTTTDGFLTPGLLASSPGSGGAYRPAPFVVVPQVIERLAPGTWLPRLDLRLRVPDQISDQQLDGLVAGTTRIAFGRARLPDGGVAVDDSSLNTLGTVLDDVRSQRSAARSAVAPAVVALVLVALAILLRLLTAAAELRLPELALASLRGVGRRRSWVLGLLEPWTLVVVGTPLGVLAGYGATALLVRSGLRPGLELVVPTASWVEAGLVAAAIAGVAVLAVSAVLRETLGAQLSGVRRPGPSPRIVVVAELVVVFLAAVLPLQHLGGGTGRLDTGDLLLPVVMAVAAGLLVTRLTTFLATWFARRGTGGPVSVFVAVRALARRSQRTLVMLPVTAAIAVAVFAVGVSGAASSWRASVADTQTPGDVVYSSTRSLQQTLDLTHRLDPAGRWLMAAARIDVPTGPLVAVDSARLARVALWSDQWLAGGAAPEAAAMITPVSTFPRVTGRTVALTLDNGASRAGLTVELSLRAAGSAGREVYVGPFGPGTSRHTVATPFCSAGCDLTALSVGGTAGLTATMGGTLRISDLTADDRPLPGALAGAGWTAAPIDASTVRSVTTRDDTLVLRVGAGEGAGGATTGTGLAALASPALVDPLPVIVGRGAAATVVDTGGSTTVDVTGKKVAVSVAGSAESLPLLGPSGVMIDLPALAARIEVPSSFETASVLARGDTPTSVSDALAAHGLVVSARAADTRRALDASAYAQALRLYLVVAVTIVLMALGGLLVSVAAQLPARRRDAASLRVVGVSRKTVAAAAFWESTVVLALSALAGLVAGLLAQSLLLGSLTLGLVDDATTPRVLPDVDLARILLLAAGVTVTLVAVSVTTSVTSVRSARAATLRETGR